MTADNASDNLSDNGSWDNNDLNRVSRVQLVSNALIENRKLQQIISEQIAVYSQKLQDIDTLANHLDTYIIPEEKWRWEMEDKVEPDFMKHTDTAMQDFFSHASIKPNEDDSFKLGISRMRPWMIAKFVNGSCDVPAKNADAKRLEEIADKYPTKFKDHKWTQPEREALKLEVILQNRENLITPLIKDFWTCKRELADISRKLETLDSVSPEELSNEQYSQLESDVTREIYLNGRMEELKERFLTVNAMSPNELASAFENLDWYRLSGKIHGKSMWDCRIQWLNNDHPDINKSEWTDEETLKLKELVQTFGKENWTLLAEKLESNRLPFHVYKHYQKQCKPAERRWTKEEDRRLLALVQKYATLNWIAVSRELGNRTPQQCSHRYLKSLTEEYKRGRWSREEDQLLLDAVERAGDKRNWYVIQNMVPGRTDVQCRERWCNCLDPALNHEEFTVEEDMKLRELSTTGGKKSWSAIAEQFIGRTDNMCSRRYKILLKDDERVAGGLPSRLYIEKRKRRGGATDDGDSTENTDGNSKRRKRRKKQPTTTPSSSLQTQLLPQLESVNRSINHANNTFQAQQALVAKLMAQNIPTGQSSSMNDLNIRCPLNSTTNPSKDRRKTVTSRKGKEPA